MKSLFDRLLYMNDYCRIQTFEVCLSTGKMCRKRVLENGIRKDTLGPPLFMLKELRGILTVLNERFRDERLSYKQREKKIRSGP